MPWLNLKYSTTIRVIWQQNKTRNCGIAVFVLSIVISDTCEGVTFDEKNGFPPKNTPKLVIWRIDNAVLRYVIATD